ncbi:unnamed protein product [Heligmosomoides polygyrus]|uniref:Uncharacterized protein n=1 Tax=Heligmosomoides polygyrus TaxID=6339 RepID=A0A3P8A710_HELPZ|nr:unnamed protein product [Heligmosomoides polygyrus]
MMSPPPTKEPRSIIKQGYYRFQTAAEPFTNRSRLPNFNELPEEERYRIMKENLERHRRTRATTPKPPITSFNGPFFQLEEVNAVRQNEGDLYNGSPAHKDYSRDRSGSSMSFADTRTISASEAELSNIKDATVVIWPPLNEGKTPRSQSVMSRRITDPDRIEEYRRQKQMEEEAMRRHEEEKMMAITKQMRAMQVQQQRLYEQRHGVVSPVPFIDVDHHPYGNFGIPQSPAPDYQSPDYGHDPHRMRVYETRPISALSEVSDQVYFSSKRHLAFHGFQRRAAFVEKLDDPPEIVRTGRRWQPPPEKPYVWPSVPRPASVDHQESQIDYPAGNYSIDVYSSGATRNATVDSGTPRSADNAEYHWAPFVSDPGFRKERKNFTPTNSPPLSPRRGHGTGPLDDVAKRQTKYLIQPSPDGSHRPKPAFRKERKTPSGGFYPHAPNAVKVVRRRPASAQGLLARVDDGKEEHIEVIHQRNYHKLDQGLNDWEKIYELPPHSSTIVGKDVPTNIDVKRRLTNFQGSIQNLQRRHENAQRSYSVDGSLPYGSVHDMSSPPASVHRSERMQSAKRRDSSRQNSQLGDAPPDPRALSPAPGHTKRMIRSMTESTQRLDPQHFQPIRDRRHSPGSQYL